MKRLFFMALFCSLFFFSCGDNGSGIKTETDTDNSSPTDVTVTPDEAEAINDTDTAATTTCGNGIVEKGEECDGKAVDCEAINNTFGFGTAPCTENCTADTAACPVKGDAKPYGSVDLSFDTTFVYNYEKAQKDASYIDKYEGLQLSAAFSGAIGYTAEKAMLLTSAEAVSVETIAYTYNNTIYVIQVAYDKDDNPLTPSIQLSIKNSVQTGEKLAMCPHKSFLQVRYLSETGDIDCLAALALNETDLVLSVDKAENLTATEGGALTLSGSKIVLYHPSSTPDGNLTQSFEEQNIPVCPVIE